MPGLASRLELETRLKGVAARLVARQFARAGFSALAGAGIALGLGVLFLDLLPRLLFATTAGVLPVAACALGGFVVATVYEFRKFRTPTLQDAALSLESRLEHDTGALGAALRTGEDSAFYRPLLVQAGEDFAQADRAPAPVLISTVRLVAVPLIVLAAGVAFLWVLTAGVPQAPGGGDEGANESPSAWAPVDIGGGRTAAEQAAYREALGMKETAATLNRSAATLQDASASLEEKTRALRNAEAALAEGKAVSAEMESIDLPGELPDSEADQQALAEKIMQAAAALADAAARIEEGAATEDTGGNGEFGESTAARELVPFPPPAAIAPRAQEALAVQTPARREMAKRAVAALERVRNE